MTNYPFLDFSGQFYQEIITGKPSATLTLDPKNAVPSTAFNAFTEDQKAVMARNWASVHHAPIDLLEHIGGASVRVGLPSPQPLAYGIEP